MLGPLFLRPGRCAAGGEIAIYSRNSENNTAKYPDIVATLPKLLKAGTTSVVLDCEAVAYDRVENKILPFQVRPLLRGALGRTSQTPTLKPASP